MLEALHVARAWGVPPLTVLAGRPQQWRAEDTLLARAFMAYEATRVDELGFPTRISEDPGQGRRFSVDEKTVNYARKALDDWRAEQEKSNRKLPPGVRPKVVYKPPPPR